MHDKILRQRRKDVFQVNNFQLSEMLESHIQRKAMCQDFHRLALRARNVDCRPSHVSFQEAGR